MKTNKPAVSHSTDAAMIDVRGLEKRFGRFKAVDGLSFSVPRGEALVLWGANGAGKTTVIKCMLGLLRYRGTIVLNGLDAQRQGRQARQCLGYVPQELAFYDDMTTLDTAAFYAQLKHVDAARAASVLDEVGLGEHAGKRVGALSGGMKQRLALALALLADPPLLVLDEPTSNLDTSAREQFLHLLAGVKASGKTILYTSHHLEEVEALGDRVLVLERGRLVREVPARGLAQALGLKRRVKLYVSDGKLEDALAVLAGDGYVAQRNGTGVYVDVRPGEKALPIRALADADIIVRDFEIV